MHISDVQGAIFDVDDTLLSNYPGDAAFGLHEYSRLAAFQEVGRRHGKPRMQAFTLADCNQAFKDAKVHTLHAAVWQMLVMVGEVTDVAAEDIDYNHPLLVEIAERKEILHEDILRSRGGPVPGALPFVQHLARQPHMAHRLAIASTSTRRDIDIFFEMADLYDIFPDERIISRERFTHAKPNPEPFDKAFATLGLPDSARGSVLAVEDDPRGIMSAKAAGLYTCAITTRFSREHLEKLEVPPDYIAESYRELGDSLGLDIPGLAKTILTPRF